MSYCLKIQLIDRKVPVLLGTRMQSCEQDDICRVQNVLGLGYNVPQRSTKSCPGTRPTALQCALNSLKTIGHHTIVCHRYNYPYHQAQGHSPAIIVETERTYDEGG